MIAIQPVHVPLQGQVPVKWILAGLAVVMGLALPHTAPAQAARRDGAREGNCRLASQVLTTGQPAARRQWALSYIGYCPAPTQVPALRAGLARAAAAGEVSTFQRLASTALYVPDDRLLDQLLSVATKATYPERIRLAAMVKLDLLRAPARVWRVEELMRRDGSDCPTAVRPHPADVAPFPSRSRAFLARLETARASLAADPAQPASIRRLARCM